MRLLDLFSTYSSPCLLLVLHSCLLLLLDSRWRLCIPNTIPLTLPLHFPGIWVRICNYTRSEEGRHKFTSLETSREVKGRVFFSLSSRFSFHVSLMGTNQHQEAGEENDDQKNEEKLKKLNVFFRFIVQHMFNWNLNRNRFPGVSFSYPLLFLKTWFPGKTSCLTWSPSVYF